MTILLLSPYHTASHKEWAEGYQRYSQHQVEIFSLSGNHWKWRMHGAAITLAERYLNSDIQADLFLATDMLDLSTFLALVRREAGQVPAILYFHENQLSYPWSPDDPDRKLKRDLHYAFINYSSALSADAVAFNSQFHLQSFHEALPDFLSVYPDHQETRMATRIREKSLVLPLGVDYARFQAPVPLPQKREKALILWNHRWEYDKNPEDFFRALLQLQKEGLDFEVAILGQAFQRSPKIFAEALAQLREKILVKGFLPRDEYIRYLWQADILPVTAYHDFFGLSTVQAIYCGCYPLLPYRLAYPGHLRQALHKKHFYQNQDSLLQKLRLAIQEVEQLRQQSLQAEVLKYDWGAVAPQYDVYFSVLVDASLCD